MLDHTRASVRQPLTRYSSEVVVSLELLAELNAAFLAAARALIFCESGLKADQQDSTVDRAEER